MGAGHDKRQRDATTVHQQMALAPIFSPGPLDWGQRAIAPGGPSSSRRQCFASARRCLQGRRIRQARASIRLQTPRPSPTPEIGHESHWNCQSAPPGAPSTGTLFAAHKQSPRRPAGVLSACAPRLPCARNSGPPGAGGQESVAQRASRILRSAITEPRSKIAKLRLT